MERVYFHFRLIHAYYAIYVNLPLPFCDIVDFSTFDLPTTTNGILISRSEYAACKQINNKIINQ